MRCYRAHYDVTVMSGIGKLSDPTAFCGDLIDTYFWHQK